MNVDGQRCDFGGRKFLGWDQALNGPGLFPSNASVASGESLAPDQPDTAVSHVRGG